MMYNIKTKTGLVPVLKIFLHVTSNSVCIFSSYGFYCSTWLPSIIWATTITTRKWREERCLQRHLCLGVGL